MPGPHGTPRVSLLEIPLGEVLTPEDVARLLKVSQRTVQRLLKAETLHAFQVGRQWRILARDLQRFCGSLGATAPAPTAVSSLAPPLAFDGGATRR